MNVDQQRFISMMADDRMATDKLSEGIKGFSKAIETLEQQLAHRLAQIEVAPRSAMPFKRFSC